MIGRISAITESRQAERARRLLFADNEPFRLLLYFAFLLPFLLTASCCTILFCLIYMKKPYFPKILELYLCATMRNLGISGRTENILLYFRKSLKCLSDKAFCQGNTNTGESSPRKELKNDGCTISDYAGSPLWRRRSHG